GVENNSQNEFLRKIGCDMVQGYYYSKPLSEDITIFAVPVTEASSRSIYVPVSCLARTVKKDSAASKSNSAPSFWKPIKWVSRRRRPILSPPGFGI
ncbi:MAG: EAL domain-containing protein, partial [Alistipes sp.]|nr:EAL domain-containing protein [Alistipes sp.]